MPAATVEALRDALNEALALHPERAKRLRLQGFSALPLEDYERIAQLESEARAVGYTRLG